MIYDIILICIIIAFIVIGALRGLARTLIGFGITFLSCILASWGAKALSDWLYTGIVQPIVLRNVTEAVDGVSSGVIGSVNDAVESLPVWLKGAFDLSGGQLTGDFSSFPEDLSRQAATSVDSAVRPVIVGFISILLTILFFFVLRFIMRKLLMRPVLAAFKLPIINTVNRVLGAALGALEGVVAVCMLAYLLRLLLPHIASQSGILNESTIYNSFIFFHFYSGNIFTMLSSWIS